MSHNDNNTSTTTPTPAHSVISTIQKNSTPIAPAALPNPTSAMHGLAMLGSSTSSSMHRIIINRLMDMSFQDFEFALLQLVHAVITHRCSRTEECLLALRRLLCRLCSQSLHFGVKLLWTIEAFSPNASKSSKSALEGLRELLEAAVVNGTEEQQQSSSSSYNNNNNSSSSNTPTRSLSKNNSFASPAILAMPPSSASSSSINNMDDGNHTNNNNKNHAFSNNSSFSGMNNNNNNVLSEHEEVLIHLKMGRLSVMNDQRLFFQQLVGISDFLRKVSDRGARGEQLRLQLLQMSSSVLQRRVFMPFSSSGQRPRWIVRILPEEAIVFSSRERAPYLLVVETVTNPAITVNHTNCSDIPAGFDQYYNGNNNNNNHQNNDDSTTTPISKRQAISNAISSLLPNSLTGESTSSSSDHHHHHNNDGSNNNDHHQGDGSNNNNNSSAGRMRRRSSFSASKNNNNNNNNNNCTNNNNNNDNTLPSSSNNNNSGNNNNNKRTFYKMCGDPDVREQTSLSLIGRNSSSFHVYAKPFGSSSDPWRESTQDRRNRLKQASPFSHLPGWNVESLVIKAGDDLTQEQLALQVVDLLHRIWRKHEVPVFVLPYQALSTVYDGGLIECINDAISIDSLKKSAGVQTLHQFFLKVFGEGTTNFSIAQRNFIESMAGYSVVCYLMQVKDRHNANLMLTRSGHLVHIDFGFMFGTSPGNIQFENAPFKMSQELLDTMGGASSEGFRYFKVLLHLALSAVREEADQLVQLITVIAPRSGIKCFGTSEAQATAVVEGLKQRLGMNIGNMFEVASSGSSISDNATDHNNINNLVVKRQVAAGGGSTSSHFSKQSEDEAAVARYVRELVESSNSNWRTTRYDQFQTWQNGII